MPRDDEDLYAEPRITEIARALLENSGFDPDEAEDALEPEIREKCEAFAATVLSSDPFDAIPPFIRAMPPGPFDVIVADPPWRYSFSKSDSRKVENQYPTMTVEEIAELAIPAAPNSVLYLWATAPKLREALRVMDAWGFEYKSHAVWDKKKLGMGYWFRGRHELLLVGVKGKMSPPPAAVRIASVIEAPRGEHSAKPGVVNDWIDKAFPGKRKLELFARTAWPGWAAWGNEIL